MKTRNKLVALMGAGVLVLGIAGVAFASTDLLAGQVGKTLGSYEVNCDEFPDLQAGQVGLQFNLTSTGATDGTLDAAFSNPTLTAHKDHVDKTDGKVIKWFVTIDGATADTTIDSATTDADGNNLVVSHVCFGGAQSETPSSEAPSSEAPSFAGSQEGATDVPSEPNTATVGAGTSSPSDGSWLFVAALGVILASVVVLTPARAKNRR